MTTLSQRLNAFKHDVTPYVWVLPIISASTWFLMLWVMLIYWLASSRPQYPSMDTGTIAYISDIGAYRLKPFFVTFSSITSLSFFMSLLSMRLNQALTRRLERCLDLAALFSGALGCMSLVLLSIFDTARHAAIHRLFLLLFMLGIVLSALFTTLEYRRLWKTNRERKWLRYSYIAKSGLLVMEAVMSVAFGWLLYRKMMTKGAVLEWVIAFVFTGYMMTFYGDLRPKERTASSISHSLSGGTLA